MVLDEWTRITTINVEGGFPIASSPPMWGYYGPTLFAGLPAPEKESRRVVRVHVGTFSFQFEKANENVVSFLVGKKKRRDRMGLRGLQEGSIVLVVKSEQEKNEAEGWVEETDEKWRSLFAVELEEV